MRSLNLVLDTIFQHWRFLMKIHYLSTSQLISDSANSVHVMRMCKVFANLGHEVTLHGYKGDGNSSQIHAYYGTENSFEIITHDEHKSGLSAFLWFCRSKFPFLKVGGFPSVLFAIQNLKPQLRSVTDIQLLYARNLYWLYAAPKGINFVAETHHPPSNFFERFIEKKIYSRSTKIRSRFNFAKNSQ